MLLRRLPDILERLAHRMIKLLADTVESPTIVLTILDPLEVADRDTAGVGQDVGQHGDAALFEGGIGGRINWAIGRFDDDRKP